MPSIGIVLINFIRDAITLLGGLSSFLKRALDFDKARCAGFNDTRVEGWHLGGGSAAAGREWENECGVEADAAHDVEGLQKFGVGFGGESADDVGGYANIGDGAAEGVDFFEILLYRVFAIHCVKDTITARLHG